MVHNHITNLYNKDHNMDYYYKGPKQEPIYPLLFYKLQKHRKDLSFQNLLILLLDEDIQKEKQKLTNYLAMSQLMPHHHLKHIQELIHVI